MDEQPISTPQPEANAKRGRGRPRKQPPEIHLLQGHKNECECPFCRATWKRYKAKLEEGGWTDADTRIGVPLPRMKRRRMGAPSQEPSANSQDSSYSTQEKKEQQQNRTVTRLSTVIPEESNPADLGQDQLLELAREEIREIEKKGIKREEIRKLVLSLAPKFGLTAGLWLRRLVALLHAKKVVIHHSQLGLQVHDVSYTDFDAVAKGLVIWERALGLAAPPASEQSEPSQLTLVAPTHQSLPGHAEFCQCQECLAAWEERSGLQPKPSPLRDADDPTPVVDSKPLTESDE